jgi:hypothetical protein
MSKLFSNLFGGGKKEKGQTVAAAPLFAANPYAVNAPAAANQPLDDAIAGLLGSVEKKSVPTDGKTEATKSSKSKRSKAGGTRPAFL